MNSNCIRWQIKAKIQFQWHTTRTQTLTHTRTLLHAFKSQRWQRTFFPFYSVSVRVSCLTLVVAIYYIRINSECQIAVEFWFLLLQRKIGILCPLEYPHPRWTLNDCEPFELNFENDETHTKETQENLFESNVTEGERARAYSWAPAINRHMSDRIRIYLFLLIHWNGMERTK